jgi:hypothetical protein
MDLYNLSRDEILTVILNNMNDNERLNLLKKPISEIMELIKKLKIESYNVNINYNFRDVLPLIIKKVGYLCDIIPLRLVSKQFNNIIENLPVWKKVVDEDEIPIYFQINIFSICKIKPYYIAKFFWIMNMTTYEFINVERKGKNKPVHLYKEKIIINIRAYSISLLNNGVIKIKDRKYKSKRYLSQEQQRFKNLMKAISELRNNRKQLKLKVSNE